MAADDLRAYEQPVAVELDGATKQPTGQALTPGLSYDTYDYDDVSDINSSHRVRGIYSPDGALSMGPLVNVQEPRITAPLPHLGTPATNSAEVGAFIGYTMPTGLDSGSSIGLNLEIANDVTDETSGLRLQPGIEYGLPLSESLRLNARLFSTYAGDNEDSANTPVGASDSFSHFSDVGQDGTFKDVGVNLRLGYTMTESWDIETRASLTRRIGAASERDTNDDGAAASEFFGGVVVNYRF